MPPKHWRKKKDAGDKPGKLLVELRTRMKIWIPCAPEDGRRLRAEIAEQMERPSRKVFDFAPLDETTVRVEAIDAVKYFPPKSAGTAPEATQE